MRWSTLAAAAALGTILAVAPLAAQTGDPRVDGALPLRLRVGEAVKLCKIGAIECPGVAAMCDDPKVAEHVYGGPDGLELRGVGPGTTLCSAASGGGAYAGARRVYRVTVER